MIVTVRDVILECAWPDPKDCPQGSDDGSDKISEIH